MQDVESYNYTNFIIKSKVHIIELCPYTNTQDYKSNKYFTMYFKFNIHGKTCKDMMITLGCFSSNDGDN